MNSIEVNMRNMHKQLGICDEAPFYTLGPLTTDKRLIWQMLIEFEHCPYIGWIVHEKHLLEFLESIETGGWTRFVRGNWHYVLGRGLREFRSTRVCQWYLRKFADWAALTRVSGRSKGTGSGRKWSLLDDSGFLTLRSQ
jgi:hypothetical protein